MRLCGCGCGAQTTRYHGRDRRFLKGHARRLLLSPQTYAAFTREADELKFHRDAFSMVWDGPALTPEEHLAYWRRIFDVIDAMPSIARETRVVTDEHGHSRLEYLPQPFKVDP